MIASYQKLPQNLPIPQDDGLSDHLVGSPMPNISLTTTQPYSINFSQIQSKFVVYCYPMTGKPNVALPEGWDAIPGARGCTPQSCSYRDHYQQIQSLNARVFGLSTQSTQYQQQMVERLHLPFPVVSDYKLQLQTALKLPTFIVDGTTLLKRITLIVENGIIVKVHYPIFPSDSDPIWVIQQLKNINTS